MKIITFVIPCYNSQDYMDKAINSLLAVGEDLDIIIVNDGSTDRTQEIAEEYAEKEPDKIRVIQQENGGHGDAVNTGLVHAQGDFFKVLDSDDWVDQEALKRVLKTLKNFKESNKNLDMLITNYVYEKVALGKQKRIHYKGALPEEKVFGWDETRRFRYTQNILMHSVTYRTELLRNCGLKLPRHTFYVDNIFVYQPLPQVKSMYYLNVDLYRYYIGRDDQSVNESNMIKRIDQQIRITKIMIDSSDLVAIESRRLRRYMTKYVSMMLAISSVFLLKKGTVEAEIKRRELWQYVRNKGPTYYRSISSTFVGRYTQYNGLFFKKVVLLIYSISKKIFGFS